MSDNSKSKKIKMTPEDELCEAMGSHGASFVLGKLPQRTSLPKELPVMALRNAVPFPGTVLPISVGRTQSKDIMTTMTRA